MNITLFNHILRCREFQFRTQYFILGAGLQACEDGEGNAPRSQENLSGAGVKSSISAQTPSDIVTLARKSISRY